ncbi:MAG: hypothetical protein AB1414_17065 [bacterium]
MAKYQGRRNFKGKLLGFEDEKVIIAVDNEIFKIPYSEIAKANLVPQM